jgi:hypothetical protein
MPDGFGTEGVEPDYDRACDAWLDLEIISYTMRQRRELCAIAIEYYKRRTEEEKNA